MDMNKNIKQFDSMSTESFSNNGHVIDKSNNTDTPQFANNIIPQSISSSKPNVFGSVAVTNSENVIFGDKHINVYNGPVSINQVISGVGNASYIQTDDERRKKEDIHPSDRKQECVVAANDLFIAPNHLRIVSRSEWLAQPPLPGVDPIIQPVPWVIIAHTATAPCSNQSECVLQVRFIQDFHISSRGWSDIAYNFLVGGDGSAYYGRGWDNIAAHTKGYNKYSIGIAFIGTFTHEAPPLAQVEACKKLIKLGVDEGKIAKDYKLFAHRQLMSTLSPGDKVYEIISQWPHFVKTYTLDLIPNY